MCRPKEKRYIKKACGTQFQYFAIGYGAEGCKRKTYIINYLKNNKN